MSGDKQPIGWWVKHVDRALEEVFDTALVDQGVTRREWQVLNAVGEGSPLTRIEASLAPFREAGDGFAAVVDGLRARGWLDVDPARGGAAQVTPTPAGHAARERLAAAVQRVRTAAMRGIEPREYTLVVDTLQRMARNLATVS